MVAKSEPPVDGKHGKHPTTSRVSTILLVVQDFVHPRCRIYGLNMVTFHSYVKFTKGYHGIKLDQKALTNLESRRFGIVTPSSHHSCDIAVRYV